MNCLNSHEPSYGASLLTAKVVGRHCLLEGLQMKGHDLFGVILSSMDVACIRWPMTEQQYHERMRASQSFPLVWALKQYYTHQNVAEMQDVQ